MCEIIGQDGLLGHYLCGEGRPFFWIHVICFLLVLSAFVHVVREARSLARWSAADVPEAPPETRPDARRGRRRTWARLAASVRSLSWAQLVAWARHSPRTTAVDQLDEFVREVRKAGPSGSLVPMTDYSDRVESVVDALVRKMYDRVFLFLLVGIAGTLFGLWEFAETAQYHLGGGDAALDRLADLLTRSMSKAFPVAFMGLVLTIAGNVAAHGLELMLRRRVARASLLAAQCRVQEGRTLTQVVEEALAPTRNLSQVLSEALAPLGTELGSRLQPLVLQLGKELRAGVQAMIRQSEQLSQRTETVANVLGELHSSMTAMREQVATLQEATGDVAGVMTALRRMEAEQREASARFNAAAVEVLEGLAQSTAELGTAARELGATSVALKEDSRAAWTSVSAEAIAQWKTTVEQFERDLGSGLQARLVEIKRAAEKAAEAVNGAAEDLERTSSTVEAVARRSFKESADAATQSIGAAVVAARDEITRGLRTIHEAFDEQVPKLVGNVEELNGALGDGLERSAAVRDRLDELHGRYAELTGAVEEGRQAFADACEELAEKVDRQDAPLLGEVAKMHSLVDERLTETSAQLARISRNGGPAGGRSPFLDPERSPLWRGVRRVLGRGPGRTA